jgi:hypothetical protein
MLDGLTHAVSVRSCFGGAQACADQTRQRATASVGYAPAQGSRLTATPDILSDVQMNGVLAMSSACCGGKVYPC